MNRKLINALISLAFVIALLPAAALAQDGDHPRSINARQREQQQRIRAGVRSGDLTRREARRLEAEEARIRAREAHARHSGGQFTARERLRIERQLNHSSRDIYRQRHDRQQR